MAKSKTSTKDTSTESATFTFYADKKHSWLFRESGEDDNQILRSIYVSKKAFGGKRPSEIALVMKSL